MPDLLLAAAIVFALVVLDVAAHRFGKDTRFDWRSDARNIWW